MVPSEPKMNRRDWFRLRKSSGDSNSQAIEVRSNMKPSLLRGSLQLL